MLSDVRAVARTAKKNDIVLYEGDVAVGIAGQVTRSSHPGWYIKMIYVNHQYKDQGCGYALVKRLLQELVDRGVTTIYLVRPKEEGRAFQGGFGFTEVEEEWNTPDHVHNAALFVASPPDPNWSR